MHVLSSSFPPGTKVFLYPPGALRPDRDQESGDSSSVSKDGTVAFDVKGADLGEFVWIAGRIGETWLAVMCSVKDGPKKGYVAYPRVNMTAEMVDALDVPSRLGMRLSPT